jgi:predicted tellurium resistance membrane protein TerC
VYYPAFFRLRRLGTTPAVILSTIAVFFGTWLLHAYQWFWLLGGVLLTWPDMLFWGLLGVLLVANTMVEMRAGRARSLQTTTWTARSLAIRSVKTVVFFATMSVLWSLWSAESVSEWLLLWTR